MDRAVVQTPFPSCWRILLGCPGSSESAECAVLGVWASQAVLVFPVPGDSMRPLWAAYPPQRRSAHQLQVFPFNLKIQNTGWRWGPHLKALFQLHAVLGTAFIYNSMGREATVCRHGLTRSGLSNDQLAARNRASLLAVAGGTSPSLRGWGPGCQQGHH